MREIAAFLAILVTTVHVLGILSAIHAILNARTAAGAIAWSMSLVTLPYAALPLYWSVGRERFYGYVKLHRAINLTHDRAKEVAGFLEHLKPFRAAWEDPSLTSVYERLARLPFTGGNRVELLVDGEANFRAIFEAIDRAERYVLLHFYIVEDDEIGRELKSHLVRAARRGVKIHFLYDEMGCYRLPWSYINELQKEGVEMRPFYTTRGPFNKLQINFRNHRKITVIDGRVAFTGGMNVDDATMGRDPFYGYWRDTNTVVEGPAVQGIQLVWLEDWYWATLKLPELEWDPVVAEEPGHPAVYLPTGPADRLDSGTLFFIHSINMARERVWLASPYFVPDDSVMDSLIAAALRGVDVRIILPARWDLLVMYLASFSYLPQIEGTGIRILRFQPGHPHQKVMLVDDRMAWVGSANADNRSMRLNFEGNLVVLGQEFAGQVEDMLARDIANSVEVGPEDYESRGIIFKAGVKLARLFSPIL